MSRQSLNGEAQFSVLWAGGHQSANWLDIAREFTERWHHQQQIRDAVAASSIETLIRSLPFWYDEKAPSLAGALIVRVTGDSGGTWLLDHGRSGWFLSIADEQASAPASIVLGERDLWLHLTCSMDESKTRARCSILGNAALAEPFFGARSVMIAPSPRIPSSVGDHPE